MLITRYYKLELLYLSKKRERKGMSLKDFKIISKLGMAMLITKVREPIQSSIK
jgi:hypothetical protein